MRFEEDWKLNLDPGAEIMELLYWTGIYEILA